MTCLFHYDRPVFTGSSPPLSIREGLFREEEIGRGGGHRTRLPLSYFNPKLSRGKKIYDLSSKECGELVRYDAKSKQFVPMLQGVSVTSVTFSRNGDWLAYVCYPDRTLRRSRSDGTDAATLSVVSFVRYLLG